MVTGPFDDLPSLVWVSVDTNEGPALTEGLAQWCIPTGVQCQPRTLTPSATATRTVVPVGVQPIVADVRVVSSAAASFGDEPTDGSKKIFLSAGLQTTSLLVDYAVVLSYETTTLVPHH